MNILFITGRYGKKAAANGICVNNVIKELSQSNEVYCICYDDFINEEDENCKVIKVRRGILHSLFYKSENNKKISSLINKLINIKNMLFIPIWPWVDPIYTLRIYRKAKKICKTKNIGIVVGVHMPLSSLIVANKLKKRNKNLKYVAYFLDSLSGGSPLSIMSKEWNLNKKLKWEKRVLNNADKIVAMASSKSHHMKYNKNSYFYDKLTYLDVPLLIDKKENNADTKYLEKNKINVVFCGTANHPLRNVPYLLNIVKKIKSKDIMFNFFGNSNCMELINSKQENIKYYSYVSHDEIPAILTEADMFLNLGTTEPSTISGKIFEYMSYGKPIISSYSIENESCIEYLKKYKNYYLYDERDKDIDLQAKKIEEYIIANRNNKVDSNQLKLDFKANLPETFKKEILEEKEEKYGNYCED